MTTALRRIVAGSLAGAVGTLAMDLLWYRRYRDGGGEDTFVDWEFSDSAPSFDEAGAPGEAAQQLTDAVDMELPDEAAGPATNVMHWLTGVGYGALHGLLQDGRNPLVAGVTTGAGAFANSYATLGAMGIYEPIWEYDRETLARDLSAHLLFGLTTGLTHAVLSRVLGVGGDRSD